MRDIRFGLVGCGRVGSSADSGIAAWAVADHWLPYSHASAITATPGARLVAVCDVAQAAVEDAQRRHGAATGYVDYDRMFEVEQLDAVAIATRTAERKNIILSAIRHGVKGFYCEKPLSTSLEDADEIQRVIDAAGAYFVYGTKRRFMPAFEDVRARLDRGEIGAVCSIVVRLGFGSLFWTYPHAVDIATYLLHDEPIESVQADLDFDETTVGAASVDADPRIRSAIIKYRSGVTAAILPGGGMDTEIVGRDGMVRIEGDGAEIRWRTRRPDGSDFGWLLQQSIDGRGAPSSGTQRGIASLVEAISNGTYPGYCVHDAVRNQEALFAMVESHLRGGSPVPLPVRRRGLTITGRTGDLFA